MRFHRVVFVVPTLAIAAGLTWLAACVGDNPATVEPQADQLAPDGSDQTIDGSFEAGCGACDGACYNGVCNGNHVRQIAKGWSFACALLFDGTVWCWGSNFHGAIAFPPDTTPRPPTPVEGLTDVTFVSAGYAHACAVRADASVWCWGINQKGELGHDPATNGVACGPSKCSPPTKVDGVAAKKVSIGSDSACAITTTNQVVCWGGNGYGQLGRNTPPTFVPEPVPAPISGIGGQFTDVVVSPMITHTACAIDTTKRLACWGRNGFGELGHPPGTADDLDNCGTDAPTAGQHCTSKPRPIPLAGGGDLVDVVSVAIGTGICAAQTNGSLVCWGDNGSGQLGTGTTTPLTSPTPNPYLNGIKEVSGDWAKCALSTAGDVHCWGQASSQVPGNLGIDAGCVNALGSVSCALMPSRIATIDSGAQVGVAGQGFGAMVLTTDGTPLGWGNNLAGQAGHPQGTAGDDPDAGFSNPTPVKVVGLP